MATIKEIRQQHDIYCKAALSDPQLADELFRPFMDEETLALIADGPPERVETTLVNGRSRLSHLDFFFLYWRKDGGRLKLVLEHKSSCDKGTPAQVCRYAALAMQEHQDAEPLIVAVLYHGEDEWNVPFAVERTGDGSRPPAAPAGAFRYPLWNLMKLDIEAQGFSPKTWIAATAMVGAFRKSVRTAQLDRLLLALPAEGDFTQQTLTYISGAWGLDKDLLAARLAELRPNEGGSMMGNTLLDVKIAAKAEGKAEGRSQGKAEVLLTQLRLKFQDLPNGTAAKVRSASPAQLDAWAAAILTATTLDALLATKPKR